MPAPADVSAVKDKLTVWTDGKKHFVALAFTTDSDSPVFWSATARTSTGCASSAAAPKAATTISRSSTASSGSRASTRPTRPASTSEGRQGRGRGAGPVRRAQDRRSSRCRAAEAKAIVDGAKFYKSRWNRYAYALARDNTGKYYYVDNQREPEDSKNFRLWAGNKGAHEAAEDDQRRQRLRGRHLRHQERRSCAWCSTSTRRPGCRARRRRS